MDIFVVNSSPYIVWSGPDQRLTLSLSTGVIVKKKKEGVVVFDLKSTHTSVCFILQVKDRSDCRSTSV